MQEEQHNQGVTSLSMLERARNRDADAWRRLVELFSPLVFFWAQRAGLAHADAADVVQDVWQSVAASLSRFQRDARTGSFRGWLRTITRNKLIDHSRKRETQPTATGGTDAHKFIESIAETEEDADDETGVQEHELLHRALAQIKPEFEDRTWVAFWRLTVDNRTAADVGTELQLAPNAVHQARFRVLRRLREEMAGLVDA